LALGAATWVGCAAYVAGALLVPSLGSAVCSLAPGSSAFGEAERSWLPPGTTCTWDITSQGEQIRYVLGPSLTRLVPVAYVIGFWPAVRLRRRFPARGA